MIPRTLMLTVLLGGSPLMAEDRILFNFESAEAAKSWQTVNDGVMGGRSDGRFRINEDKSLEVFGTLSLENNGGFASVRARGIQLGLEKGDTIVARVRGDGRQYNFDIYSQQLSFRQSFKTKKDEWIEVTLPLDNVVATWRGRVFPNEKLDLTKVAGLGIMLGDKKPGPFKLEVDWIKVVAGLSGERPQ